MSFIFLRFTIHGKLANLAGRFIYGNILPYGKAGSKRNASRYHSHLLVDRLKIESVRHKERQKTSNRTLLGSLKVLF